MERIEIPVTCKEGAVLPTYGTEHSSGVDLRAFVDDPVTIGPLERCLVPTGIAVAIPPGYEAEVRPRSGLAIKHGITVLNSPGTIDADYRGEVQIILINLGVDPFTINRGDRIAQMVLKKIATIDWAPVGALPETERGTGGFGSTGIAG